ncbi:transglycosylase family protein [Streptomyces sp. NPDC052701]|uniref:transglycosylase family protein n=1 Tax=Streptomyces sp. NPDC052701 TaxID=3155533 RepID=UPI003432D88D
MLSGNGRHRRPRQAPALLVAAGVTGSAIAIPLLGASGASAADGTTWDRVAECETGGAWSQNSGNGYYGGLQVTQEDWEAYGGLDYAASADQASRSQQIAVAERILADQGVGAWGTCGLTAGLDKDSTSVDIDTGVADDASGTSGSSGSSGSSGLLGGAGSTGSSRASGSPGSAEDPSPSPSSPSDGPSKSADEKSKSGKPSGSDADSDSGDSGSPRPDGSPTAGPEGGDPADSGRTDGSSAPADTGTTGSGRHRGPSAQETAEEGRAAASAGRHASRGEGASRGALGGSYTVREGDSLWSIADSLDLSGGWQALYEENEKVVGADPNRIVPGQDLEVGVEPGKK